MSHSAEPDDEPPDEPQAQPAHRMRSRLATIAPVLIAVAAGGVAIWALLRPSPDTPAPPSAQQVTEAKTRACAAYDTVRSAVALQTQAGGATDPIAGQAVAANARLAMSVGGQHLLDNLGPAVPSELAALLRSVSTDLQDLTINALAGTADDDAGQVARLHDLESTSTKIVELCK